MKITTIGLDLAKNVFQVHGVNERGVSVLGQRLTRDQVAPYFARLEPCLIGIEACGGAHFWAAEGAYPEFCVLRHSMATERSPDVSQAEQGRAQSGAASSV